MFYATFYIKMKWFFSVWWVGGPHYVNNAFPGSNLQLQDFKQNWNPMLDPKSSIFVVQKAAAPKSGIKFRQGSVGTISSSLATLYNVWRCRARKKICWRRVGGLVAEPMCRVGWLRSLCVGRFLVHFIATSWSNLQACKISSIAEIPKLDRVWQ